MKRAISHTLCVVMGALAVTIGASYAATRPSTLSPAALSGQVRDLRRAVHHLQREDAWLRCNVVNGRNNPVCAPFLP